MLTMQLLGGFRLGDATGSIDVPLRSAQVLAFLGLRRAPVSRAALAANLWPEVDASRALGNLRSAIWRLPAAAHDAVRRRDECLIIGDDVSCDVDHFNSATTLEGSRIVPLAGVGLCADLLPGWYDDWILAERDRLALLRAELFEELSKKRHDEGKAADAVLYAVASILVEPFRESAHRALLRAHALQGNYGEMVGHYRTLARLLQEEIGVAPSSETDRILASCGIQLGDAMADNMSPWDL